MYNATETSSKVVHDTMAKRVAAMDKLTQLKEEENILTKDEMEFKAMHVIMSDKSSMNESHVLNEWESTSSSWKIL